MKEIILTQGKVALVDDEDYERINQYKWIALKQKCGFYAIRKINTDGKRVNFKMCREILMLSVEDKCIVDHRDRNTLRNLKENLRITDKSLNSHNCKIYKNNKSGYRGVSWHKDANKWQVHFKINGKSINCGIYTDATKAAMAYDLMATKYWGEDATLNFPGGVK